MAASPSVIEKIALSPQRGERWRVFLPRHATFNESLRQIGRSREEHPYHRRSMAGAALGKLWGTNPRLACVLQLLVCLMLGGFGVAIASQGRDWLVVGILAIGFSIETGSLVIFTREAMQNG